MSELSVVELIDQVDTELAALQPEITAALDAEQQKLDAAADAVRASNPDVQRAEVNRSDEVRLESARQHLATVRMHVAEIRHTV